MSSLKIHRNKITNDFNKHYFRITDTNKCYTDYTVKIVQANLITAKILGDSLLNRLLIKYPLNF